MRKPSLFTADTYEIDYFFLGGVWVLEKVTEVEITIGKRHKNIWNVLFSTNEKLGKIDAAKPVVLLSQAMQAGLMWLIKEMYSKDWQSNKSRGHQVCLIPSPTFYLWSSILVRGLLLPKSPPSYSHRCCQSHIYFRLHRIQLSLIQMYVISSRVENELFMIFAPTNICLHYKQLIIKNISSN